MTKYLTVETRRAYDEDKVLRIAARFEGNLSYRVYDANEAEVEAHEQAALACLLTYHGQDFEIMGYGELDSPTHLVFFFQRVPEV